MNSILAVFIGGGIGSVLRYMVSLGLAQASSTQLPWATLTSNLISTIILGIVVFRIGLDTTSWWFYLLVIGLCGGFSTFSTFSNETFSLLKAGEITWAVANVLVSIGACLILLFILAKHIK